MDILIWRSGVFRSISLFIKKKGLDLIPIVFAVLSLFHPPFDRLATPYSLAFLLIAHGATNNSTPTNKLLDIFNLGR